MGWRELAAHSLAALRPSVTLGSQHDDDPCEPASNWEVAPAPASSIQLITSPLAKRIRQREMNPRGKMTFEYQGTQLFCKFSSSPQTPLAFPSRTEQRTPNTVPFPRTSGHSPQAGGPEPARPEWAHPCARGPGRGGLPQPSA